MLSVEIHKSLRSFRIPPDLSQQSGIRGAHQLLSDNIQTMRDMVPNNGAVVDESTFSFGAVVIDVVVEALTNEVETM
jgi:hypothetical protein